MYLELGTRTTGTLKTADILEAFWEDLRKIKANGFLTYLEAKGEPDAEDLNDAYEHLEAYTPPFSYVGSIEGDGAHIGIFPLIEEAKEDEDVQVVSDLSEVDTSNEDDAPDYVLLINDHGNATLYDWTGTFEFWSVV